MDANRDDAVRCLEKARAAYRSGDFEKARRLAQKSKRLFPTKKCEGKLTEVTAAQSRD